MGKARYITDGRIFFVKVTVVLKDGKILSAIDDTTVADIDANWNVYWFKAKSKWGGKIDSFQVVQLSKYDPEVRQYIKAGNIHLPSEAAEEQVDSFGELKLSEEVVKQINKLPVKKKQQPGKYRT